MAPAGDTSPGQTGTEPAAAAPREPQPAQFHGTRRMPVGNAAPGGTGGRGRGGGAALQAERPQDEPSPAAAERPAPPADRFGEGFVVGDEDTVVRRAGN